MSSAPLFGLVLAGGHSTRMGEDKGKISWHGKPQRLYMADTLSALCDDVYISCRKDQVSELPPSYKSLTDSVEISGPIAGIMSAFALFPDVAWLVVACDLPLLDYPTLHSLTLRRDSAKIATVFSSPSDGLPEPLIAIWEPSALPVLNAHIQAGLKCPRKLLMRNEGDVLMIENQFADALMNANTPDDREAANRLLYRP